MLPHEQQEEQVDKIENENSTENPDSNESTATTSDKCKSRKIKVSNLEEAKLMKNVLTKKTDAGYQCTVCNYVNRFKPTIDRHIEIHFDGLIYNCPSCGKGFSTRNTFHNHKSRSCRKESDFKEKDKPSVDLTEDSNDSIHSIHSNKSPMDTEQTAVQNKKILNKIKEFTEIENGLYECTLCDFTSSFEQSLKIHIEYRHLEGLEYECNLCSQVLATKYALEKHQKRIHGQDEIQEPIRKKATP